MFPSYLSTLNKAVLHPKRQKRRPEDAGYFLKVSIEKVVGSQRQKATWTRVSLVASKSTITAEYLYIKHVTY